MIVNALIKENFSPSFDSDLIHHNESKITFALALTLLLALDLKPRRKPNDWSLKVKQYSLNEEIGQNYLIISSHN